MRPEGYQKNNAYPCLREMSVYLLIWKFCPPAFCLQGENPPPPATVVGKGAGFPMPSGGTPEVRVDGSLKLPWLWQRNISRGLRPLGVVCLRMRWHYGVRSSFVQKEIIAGNSTPD